MSTLNEYLEQVFDEIVDAYREEVTRQIEEPQAWGAGFGRTVRSDGSVVEGGFRNIVDTSELKDSQSDQRVGRLEHEFRWDATHAIYVHEGTREVPPRPFTRRAAQNLDIQDLIS